MRRRYLVVCMVSLLMVTAGLLSCQVRAGAGDSSAMAPDFELRDLDGQLFRLAHTRGKVVILDFWATWCPPCKAEMPHFQDLHEKYADQGFEMIGISLDRGGAATVKPFARANGITYRNLIADQKVVTAYGGIRGIPTTFVIDREGRIVKKLVGYRDKEVFESLIRKLL